STPPPDHSIFFNLPSAKNPIHRLSGDQNGCPPFSVPGRRRGVSLARLRTKSTGCPPEMAPNTTFWPSGEISGGAADELKKLNDPPAGGRMPVLTAAPGRVRTTARQARNRDPSVTRASAAAPAHRSDLLLP